MREFEGIDYDDRHGGPFDRGAADSWYNRGINPHFFLGDTGSSTRIEITNCDTYEYEAYIAGYNWNEQFGGKKEW